MLNFEKMTSCFKSISVITLAITTCALASTASAQTSPQTLENAQPTFSQSFSTVKSAETKLQVTPKYKRIVKNVPTSKWLQKSTSASVITTNTSERNAPTRFIYTRRVDPTPIPVYFNEESKKSR